MTASGSPGGRSLPEDVGIISNAGLIERSRAQRGSPDFRLFRVVFRAVFRRAPGRCGQPPREELSLTNTPRAPLGPATLNKVLTESTEDSTEERHGSLLGCHGSMPDEP
jgi:hypothetical protein